MSGDLSARLDYGGVWLRADVALRYQRAMDVVLRQARARSGGGDVPADIVAAQQVLALLDVTDVSASGQRVAVTLPSPAASTHDLLGTADVADRLNVSARTVRRMADRGDLRCVRAGRRRVFRAADIDEAGRRR